MKLKIFAVRDRATDQYGTPMFLTSTGQAIRAFADEINNKEATNLLFKHSEDYELFELGNYDTEIGTFETQTPRQIATGKELKIEK